MHSPGPARMGCDYQRRRVVVSGCASGIGQATARLLGALGAEVHGFDRQPTELELHSYQSVDLRDAASIDGAVDKLGGCVDALFNCAGLGFGHDPLEVLKVNYLGTRYLSEQVLRRMTAGGAIVSVASNGGSGWRGHLELLQQITRIDSFDQAAAFLQRKLPQIKNAYALSKELLIVWALEQSSRLIERGIRINCTSPGAVQTPMLEDIEKRVSRSAIDAVCEPMGRRSSPEEQAWSLVALNSDAASYINGVDLAVDGGFAARMSVGTTSRQADGASSASEHGAWLD